MTNGFYQDFYLNAGTLPSMCIADICLKDGVDEDGNKTQYIDFEDHVEIIKESGYAKKGLKGSIYIL